MLLLSRDIIVVEFTGSHVRHACMSVVIVHTVVAIPFGKIELGMERAVRTHVVVKWRMFRT